jgi:hypothetical protein
MASQYRRKHRIQPRIPAPQTALFDTKAVEAFLIAFGDDEQPLPETVKVLDEIVTEYVHLSHPPFPISLFPLPNAAS